MSTSPLKASWGRDYVSALVTSIEIDIVSTKDRGQRTTGNTQHPDEPHRHKKSVIPAEPQNVQKSALRWLWAKLRAYSYYRTP